MGKDNSHQSVTRRRALQLGATASSISLAGCFGGGGDTIRFLSRGGTTQDAIADIMEKWSEDSGVTVEHQEASADQEMIEILSQNPGEIDLTDLSSTGLAHDTLQHDNELLHDFDYGEIPNYTENIRDDWQDAPPIEDRDDAIAFFASTHGLAYNTDEVDDPTSWDVMDEYEGSLMLYNVSYARFGTAAIQLGYDPTEAIEDESTREEVWEQVSDHNDLVFDYWSGGDEFMRMLQEEQAYVCEAWGGRVEALHEDGYPVDYVIPDEGALTWSNWMNIPEASENKEDAYDLINWLYEPENGTELALDFKYSIPFEEPDEEMTELFEYVESPDDLTWIDFEVMFQHMDELEDTWAEIRE
ncbi:spermidine/putrescine transport system substrate-binding protein [Natronorubrum sediminis]|uniref:Spermidine/putrescine transport system substrate-binding protein n=1 Tax=Natronorubrum sediminis TaxID=640943 RepID=A0A1H6FXC7_9EURY|nr:extracellular solute-binding protein [Natronorubrum sediminis]SEH14464.1 spermidine/putrescine transport system substrate-binding protein [Natronorubrum sediminis]